jgi:putative transposase
VLVNNLKSASSRQLRAKYESHLRQFYWKSLFWHRIYYTGSVGHASLETVKRYVEYQNV